MLLAGFDDPFAADEGFIDSWVAADSTESHNTSTLLPQATSFQAATSFQESLPDGLQGTVAEDQANYFDALLAYYETVSAMIGVEDGVDWQEVT